MKRFELDSAMRSLGGAALCLWLALLGLGAQAAPAPHAGAWSIAPAVDVARDMPAGMDCVCCVGCACCQVVFPPAKKSPGDDFKPCDAQAWPIEAVAPGESITWFDTEGEHERLPVRIAFCRRLD